MKTRLDLIAKFRTFFAITWVLLIFLGVILSAGLLVFKIHQTYMFLVTLWLLGAGVICMLIEIALRIWHWHINKELEMQYQLNRTKADIAAGSRQSQGKIPS
jgi:membrane protein YdbS with pleckstrin-like domain